MGRVADCAAAGAGRSQPPSQVAQEIALLVLAAALFVLPLIGLHNRLAVEKTRLMTASQERVKAVLGRIHEAVDGGDLDRSAQLKDALGMVTAERDLLARLPTWPWSTSTFRGVASALLLPIAIFLVTRLIDRLL
jgi:hypothetical protein